jgi:hypothetical protein
MRKQFLRVTLLSLSLAVMLAACSDPPVRVTLSMLASDPARFDGRTVTTEGVVRKFAEPLHYWLEDKDVNRVELEPASAAADYLDQRVLVTGRFRYSQREGRRIRVQQIESVGEASHVDTGNY